MKKIISIVIVFVCILSVASAQEGDTMPSEFRPLGRFSLVGGETIISPDGYFIADLYQEEKAVAEESQGTEPTEPECVDFESEECYAEWDAYYIALDEYFNPPANYIYTITLWDIREGKELWQTIIEDRNYSGLVFAPDSSSLLIKTTLPFPDTEEVRLSFYDTVTGKVISETGDINPFDAPIIPGTLDQPLTAEPVYTADGAHAMVSYWRRAEETRCAVWAVATGEIVWEKDTSCGSVSPDGKLAIIPAHHSNPFSDYDQVVVYEVVSGAEVARTEDEAANYEWVDDSLVVVNRAYGDPPILWDVATDSRAVIELPYPMGLPTAVPLSRVMFYVAPDLTYIWDKANGALLGSTSVEGYLWEQADRVLVFQFEYETVDEEEFINFIVRDLTQDEELWRMRWDHEVNSISPDGEKMLAYNYTTGLTEIIQFDTGEVLGTIPLSGFDFYITPDWQWIVQSYSVFYTVWGLEEFLGQFEDQPEARLKEATMSYYEANDEFPAYDLVGDQYVWLQARSEDNQWILLDSPSWGNIWVPASSLELEVSMDSLEVYTP
jgi:hypothetical protein